MKLKEIIINLTGKLDPVTGSELYLKIKELLAEPHLILLDMTHLQEIDETGQVYLEKIREKAVPPSLVAICGLADHLALVSGEGAKIPWPVFGERKEAIAYLTAEAGKQPPVVFRSFCPVCGTGLTAQAGNSACSHCGTRLFIHASGRVTAYERLF